MLITGFDANTDALIAIKEGRMSATIDQVPDKQVRQAIQLMIRHLDKGETFPPAAARGKSITMATQENISKFVQ